MTFVLIHSPLVGPLSWKLTAEALTSTGLRSDHTADHQPDGSNRQLSSAARRSDSGPTAGRAGSRRVLGLAQWSRCFASSATRGGGSFVSLIFVDCDLPEQGKSRFDQFPADLHAAFRAQASDGMLPLLWSEADLESTLVCADIRRRFVEELRPTPLRVYDEPIPVGIGAEDRDHGYVLLTKQYGDSFDIASARGWVTERRESSHFHLLNQPAKMAEILVSVGTRIGERIRNRDQTAP